MMSHSSELEQMIKQFKTSDLLSLLQFAGVNKYGRRQDLQREAISLLHNQKSMSIEMKIKNIHKRNQFEDQHRNGGNYNYDNNNSRQTRSFNTESKEHLGYYNNSNGYRQNNISNNYQPASATSSTRDPRTDFVYCDYLDQSYRIPDPIRLKNVRFKVASFYKVFSCVVPPTALIPQRKINEDFEYNYQINLNSRDHSYLKDTIDHSTGKHHLLLRFFLLSESNLDENVRVEDSLPLAITVRVNDKTVMLPPPIPSTNKQGMLLKRFNFPIVLTPQLSRKQFTNALSIDWSVESRKLYGFEIDLVEKFSSEELVSRLKHREAEHTKSEIINKMREEEDVAATALKISLICPLGKVRLALPCRATTCEHIQCFDGSLYVKMNEVKSIWQCPVCNKSCAYEDLFIDDYFIDILKTNTVVSDIETNSDGSWTPMVTTSKKKHVDEGSRVGEWSEDDEEDAAASRKCAKKARLGEDASPLQIEIVDCLDETFDLSPPRSSSPVAARTNEDVDHIRKPAAGSHNTHFLDMEEYDDDDDDVMLVSEDDEIEECSSSPRGLNAGVRSVVYNEPRRFVINDARPMTSESQQRKEPPPVFDIFDSDDDDM